MKWRIKDLKALLDKNSIDKIKALHGSMSIKDLAVLFSVKPHNIRVALHENYSEYKKKINVRYYKKLKEDPTRYAKLNSSIKKRRRERYHDDERFKEKVDEINKDSKKNWLANPDNRKHNNKGARRLYSIKTGKFIKDFFRSLEND